MANISDEIRAFKSAVLGEDVRDGFISLANKLNDEIENIAGGGGSGGGVDSVARKTATDALSKANTNEISINDLETSVDDLSTDSSKISSKANTNEKDISALKTRMKNAETRIDDIQEYIDSGGGSGGEAGVDTEARRTASEALSKANANEADIAEYKPKVDELITDLDTVSSTASEALTKATTNRATLSTLGGKVDELQTTVAGHTNTLILNKRTLEVYDGLFKAIDKRRHSVSVKEFDAKGDGVTDDTVAIQIAINEAHAQGMDVFIPAGTYLLATELYEAKNGDTSACLHMYSNMKIYGERNTVLKAGTSVDHIIFNEVNDNATGYSGGSSMILDTLIFDGNANRTTPITPINFSHARDIIIRNVQVRNIPAGIRNGVDAWWHAIEINGCRNVHIENCIFRDNVYCSEIIQLDYCMGGGNLGTNDHTPCYAIFIHDCHFVCRGGRAVGNHSDIELYNNQQKWHEYIYIYNNHIEGRCHGGSNDPTKTAANGRGFIRFEYHTRRLSIFNNLFKRSVYLSGDSSTSSLPENNGGRTYYGVLICRTYKRDGVESDPRPASFDIDIHDNQFFNIFKSVENPMLFNVHDNTNDGVIETGTVEKLRNNTAFDVPPQTDEYDGMYFDEQNRSEGQLWFKFGAGLRVTANGYFNASYGYLEEYIRLALTWDQIIASMQESYSGLTVASHDGYTDCIQVPNDSTIVFDYADKKVKLITCESTPNGSGGTTWTSDSIKGTQVVLFANRYGNAVNMHRSLSHLWSNIQLRKLAESGGGGSTPSTWTALSQSTFFDTSGSASIIEYAVWKKGNAISGFIKFKNITTGSNGVFAFPGYAVKAAYRGPTNVPVTASLHIDSVYEAGIGYINASDGGVRVVNAAGNSKTYSQVAMHFAYTV